MTPGRDDMVIRPRFKTRDTHSPRERAQEERRTDKVKKKKSFLLRKLRKVRLVREVARAGRMLRVDLHAKKFAKWRTGGLGGASMAGRSLLVRGAGRLIPIAGWTLLIMDLVMLGHEMGRRVEGKSKRLVEAEDAHTMMRFLDEDAKANAVALAYLQQDGATLRGFAREGKVTSSIMANAHYIRQIAKARAMGEDMINRDPYFDSADSLLDLLMRKVRGANLKGLTDETIRKIKERGFGRVKSTR
jgi:hypothetical protein